MRPCSSLVHPPASDWRDSLLCLRWTFGGLAPGALEGSGDHSLEWPDGLDRASLPDTPLPLAHKGRTSSQSSSRTEAATPRPPMWGRVTVSLLIAGNLFGARSKPEFCTQGGLSCS